MDLHIEFYRSEAGKLEMVDTVIQDYQTYQNRPFDISRFYLNSPQLTQLRNSSMDLTWDYSGYVFSSTKDLELRLEALEWLPLDRRHRFDYTLDDRIILRLKERNVRFGFHARKYFSIDECIEYVRKHQLADVPVEYYQSEIKLREYCKLINHSLEKIPIAQSDWTHSSLTRILHNNDPIVTNRAIMRREFDRDNWKDHLSIQGLYNLFSYPELASPDTQLFLTDLINLDLKGEYYTDPKFLDYWPQFNHAKITNRRFFKYLREIGIEVRDPNQIIEDHLGILIGDEGGNVNPILEEVYYKLDLVDRLDREDVIISFTYDKNSISWEIILRLLRKKKIDLRPYQGINPLTDNFASNIITHLIQFQPRTNVKNARTKLA